MENKKPIKEGVLSSIIVFFLAALAIVSLALPYARYVDSKVTYKITGLQLVSGTDVMRGKASIEAQGFMFSFLFIGATMMMVAAIAYAVFYRFKKGNVSNRAVRFFGLFTIFGGLLGLVSPILYMYNSNSMLKVVKKPSNEMGIYITLIIALIAICYGVSILYRNKTLHVLDFFVLPGLIYLIINNYIPMSGVIIAFKNLNFSTGIFSSPWAGWDNFKFLFQSNDAFYIIRNTILYNIVFIITGNLLGIVVGYFLSECVTKIVKRTSQTLILLPQLLSAVIIAYIVYGFLSTDAGWINKTILRGENNISFYSSREYWPFILTIVYLWKSLGYNSLIYLSSIVSIDRNLYEAAYIDGCGKFKQFTKITLPMLVPTIIVLVTLSVGRIMNSDFGLFYQTTMNSGALYKTTQTLDVYVYRAIMETQNLGMGAASAAFQSVVGFVLIVVTNGIVRKVDKSNALF